MRFKLVIIAAGVAAATFSALPHTACAQNKLTVLSYNVGFPSGDTKDFIDDTSWLGFSFDFRSYKDRKSPIMVGFHFAWQVFDKRTSGTTVLENGAITGTQRRYINSLPFLLTGHYYLGDARGTKYFAGLGAGAYYIIDRLEIGVAAFEENNWHFGLMPEVGVQVPLSNIDGILSAQYHYAFKSGQTVLGDGRAESYWVISAGLGWKGW